MELLLCALVLSLASCQDYGQPRAIAYYQYDGQHQASQVTLCPEDYSPRNDCVTLDQLMSGNLIKSNTIFKFKPATFEIKQGIVIRFEHVSNITLEPAGGYQVNITCVERNSGFSFNDVSGLVVQNMTFTSCAHTADTTVTQYGFNVALCINESSDVMLEYVTFRDGIGGIAARNVYGNFSVQNTLFIHNKQNPALSLLCQNRSDLCSHCYSAIEQATVVLSNSQFIDSQYTQYVGRGMAYAVNIQISQWLPTAVHLVNVTVANNTHESDTSGIHISSDSALVQTVVKGVNYTNNHVTGAFRLASGASDFLYESTTNGESYIEIIDSSFVNNDFADNSQATNIYNPRYGVVVFRANNLMISIYNLAISNNSCWYGAAILQELYSAKDGHKLGLLLENSIVSNNPIQVSNYYDKGAVQLNSIGNITVHNCSFVNNSATGLLVENSNISFGGYNIIRGNRGYNGGGMALYSGSTLTLSESATILFEDNVAENNGGGLYVKEGECDTCGAEDDYCFVTVDKHKTALLHFSNNLAKTAGNDWYGGNLYCMMDGIYGVHGWQVITEITDFPANYTLDLTSDPLHVCDCSAESESIQGCIRVNTAIHTIHTYPGKSFNLSLLAVGQLLDVSPLSGVPSAIYAGLLPLPNKSGSIPDIMTVQNSARNCSNLTYRVNSPNPSETMVLTVDIDKIPEYYMGIWQQTQPQWSQLLAQVFLHHLTVPAFVTVHLQKCPVGFDLSGKGECNCSSHLIDYVISCSIDSMNITRKSPIWISFANSSRDDSENNASYVYLVHEHCPFDYCLSGELDFSLEYPDTQCNHSRSGILCGECKPGYSLTLGANECKQCTNIYLLLLIPFGLAGILLIVFLSLTDMTVTAGTINGLLFFANIVRENQATFFPPRAAKGFLSVFIAWSNLDFGISTCLYDGLDAYAFTWLQFAFPIFIWLLAFGIIIASKHFVFMNKLCGRNIVHVLATLFLLSYAKFQRTITACLSSTVVVVTKGTDLLVWLNDGNVPYLEGKHIPLFLVGVLLLLVLFIPYTLSITFGPWLQSKTQYKVFCWVLKLKPLFDAYFGPLKDKHRYWTGVLLLSRLILSLISSVNVLGDSDINLLATIILIFFLLVLLWQSGGVYKIWIISVLDSFFLINLGILSLVTSYNHRASKKYDSAQYATICVSVGSVFAVFCLILLYHCLKRLGLLTAISKRHPLPGRVPLLEEINNREENSDEDMLNAIDEDRISDPQIMRASNTKKSCNPDTY